VETVFSLRKVVVVDFIIWDLLSLSCLSRGSQSKQWSGLTAQSAKTTLHYISRQTCLLLYLCSGKLCLLLVLCVVEHQDESMSNWCFNLNVHIGYLQQSRAILVNDLQPLSPLFARVEGCEVHKGPIQLLRKGHLFSCVEVNRPSGLFYQD
jgi:hypothetical protein